MTEQISSNDDAARRRRNMRLQKMKRLKEIQMRRRRFLKIAVPVVIIAVIAITVVGKVLPKKAESEDGAKEEIVTGQENTQQVYGRALTNEIAESSTVSVATNAENAEVKEEQTIAYSAKATDNTVSFSDEVFSNYGVFIDLDSDTILAQRNGKTRISPASMTKVLTVLVAAEHLTDISELDKTFTMTLDITDYGYVNDCSSVGFLEGEEVTVWGLPPILPEVTRHLWN